MTRFSKFVFILVIIFIAAGWLTYFIIKKQSTPSSARGITIGQKTYIAEIADTEDKRILGLSGRDSLPANSTLLFVFPRADYWGIWMKDMKFPIDIVWLDQNNQVVGLKENAMPESYPEAFTPDRPASYVIEANVGFIQDAGLSTGSVVDMVGR